METSNILYARMICPSCDQVTEAEIKLNVGDIRYSYRYTIGDHYDWRPHASVQNGGRPENGNIDAEGVSDCPVCGAEISIKVAIRNDIVTDVFFNSERDIREGIPSPFYFHQPAQAIQIPLLEPDLPRQGEITFDLDVDWLTNQRRRAISRLAELGVDIYAPNPNAQGKEFRIMIPHGLHPTRYIDIAYLMTQLVDEDFREPLVEYVDSYPQGVKYRVKNSGDESRRSA